MDSQPRLVPPVRRLRGALLFALGAVAAACLATPVALAGTPPASPDGLVPSASGAIRRQPVAEWTVMVYMNGDNDLEKWVAHDIEQEMGAVGSDDAVQIVALADRSPKYDKTHGDWRGALLFHIVKGQQATADEAVADWGERNMGSPQTLVDFMEWTHATYPAKRYALVLWDHAWSWRPSYLSWDESSNDALDLPGLREALDVVGPVDVVGFDSCASQCVEGQAELRGHAAAVAASEDFIGYTGFEYGRVLADLQAKPATGAIGCAKVFARSMTVKPDRWTCASSAVRLDAAWDELLFAVDRLSWRLRDALRRHRPAVRAALAATLKSPDDPTIVDLYDAARQIRARVPSVGVRSACRDVMLGVRNVVGYNWSRGRVRGAHGISVYWPYGPAPHGEPAAWWNFTYYAAMLTWSQECGWDEFLAAWGS